jgi:hypothetical protein
MTRTKQRIRWSDYYLSARVAGIRSPQNELRKAMINKIAKRIGWGIYEIDLRRIDLPPSWERRR